MKNKKERIILGVLIAVNGFYPLISLVSYLVGYSVSVFNHTVCSLWLAVAFMYSYYFLSKNKDKVFSKSESVLAAVLPLVTCINLIVFVWKCESSTVVFVMLFCLFFAALTAGRILKSKKSKVVSVTSSILLCIVSIAISLLVFSSSYLLGRTLENHILSPERTYYADVVNVDQGALGGNTVVYVHRSRGINLFWVSFTKIPQKVYVGEWGKFETMQIEWKNEKTLIIDGKEYSINI